MKAFSKKAAAVLLLLAATLLLCVPVSAAKVYKNQWQAINGKCYYYNAKGKKVTGLKKIKHKRYYFDANGVQRTSWQKIGKYYYYFTPEEGQKGCMVKSKTVNGIPLKSGGRAQETTENKDKLDLMVTASKTVESITDWSMSKTDRLWKCFEYTKSHYQYYVWRKFPTGMKNWDRLYAADMLYRGRGNCFSYAAAYAYLANAVGYEAYVVSSGGHGWAEINGRVHDPDWALASRVDTYFAMSYDLSGVNGRPRYKWARYYVVKV